MGWVTCTRRFIAQEGHVSLASRLFIRDPKREATLVSKGLVKSDVPVEFLPYGAWEGRTVAVIASGPSLIPADVEAVIMSGALRLVVNDGYRMDPNADMLYACDLKWWKAHHEAVEQTAVGVKVTRDSKAATDYGLRHVQSENRPGLSVKRGVIHEGGNSGYQAVNLAYLMGARRIILLGFDMGRAKGAPSHWFGSHPTGLEMASPYADWIKKFDKMAEDLKAAGVEVVNCSRFTKLECFPRKTLAEALQWSTY